MSRIKFAVIGGDKRYKYLCGILEKEGWTVNVHGNKYCEDDGYKNTLKNANAVIAPIPFSKDDINVNMDPGDALKADELIQDMIRNNIKSIICGVLSDKMRKKFMDSDIKAYDFFDMEEVAVYNAVPTAEGAVMTAIQESSKVLFGKKALVIGCGRCGRVLANMLKGIGADVYVTFRKRTDRTYINVNGMKAVNIEELNISIGQYDFIFNTAPALVLDNKLLEKINKDSVIIDIAQAPGGLDYSCARRLDIKAVYCPGLPGRTAPYTAAEILRSAIVDIVPYL